MSDAIREAFEQWAVDKTFLIKVSAGDGYFNVRDMALEVWQAALQQSESEPTEQIDPVAEMWKTDIY